MQKKILLLLLLVVPFQLFPKDKPIYFLSKGRTGTSWSLYITQALTNKSFFSLDGGKPYHPHPHHEVDVNLQPIFRTHSIKKLPKNFNHEGSLLMTTLRDYHETLFRSPPHMRFNRFTPFLKLELDKYAKILKVFDQFPESRRLLISYESLMKNPPSEIGRIFTFLKKHDQILDEQQFTDFFENYEENRAYMLNRYDKAWNSYTKGNHVQFHRNKASLKLIEEMRFYLQKQYPVMWKKYFSRYK